MAKKFVVGEEGYIMHEGKIFKTGEEVELSDKQAENVEGRVFASTSDEGKALKKRFGAVVSEQDGEKDNDPAPEDDKNGAPKQTKQTKQDK